MKDIRATPDPDTYCATTVKEFSSPNLTELSASSEGRKEGRRRHYSLFLPFPLPPLSLPVAREKFFPSVRPFRVCSFARNPSFGRTIFPMRRECKAQMLKIILGARKWLARGCENVAAKLREKW